MYLKLVLLPVLFCWYSTNAQITINEFMASNTATLTDPNGAYDDWVELYNAGTSPVNIAGMYITDNLSNPTQYQIPASNASATTIPAGGFLIIWFDNQPSEGPTHVVPKLSAGGEAIGLYQSNGTTVIDTITFGQQYADISFGRTSDGGSVKNYFGTPTPNASNNASIPGLPATMPPVFSVIGGIKSAPVTVTLTSATSGAAIYYTINGTPPSTASTLYTGPVNINSSLTLRAIAVATPLLPSAVVSNTYIFNAAHTFPVVAMSVDPLLMFDTAVGMYPNYTEEIEIPCNIEMYENNGSLAFNQLLETEIQGTASALLPQKSLALKAKSSLGSSTINYPVFNDLPFTQYRSLVLRNSGQDWNYTMFRDAMATSLVHDISDLNGILDKPKLNTSDYRPSVVYINGAYWGIHNIRERQDWRYLKTHFDLDDTDVDIISEENEIEEGDITEWNNFQNYLTNNTFTTADKLTELSQKVDIDEYLDYIVFNVYIDNTDWPSNNNRRWRERVPDGKWHWYVKDLDFSFGMFQLNGGWNTGDATQNSLSRLFNSTGYLWPNAAWSTLLFRKLIENPIWKRDFINRMADQMNTAYTPARVNARISDFQNTYQPEMQLHFNKWNGGWSGNWIPNIEKLRSFANNRLSSLQTHFDAQFSEITGTCTVNITTNPVDKGTIEFSTLNLSDAQLPWSGTYFKGNPIPMKAIADRGYVFTDWTPAALGTQPDTTVTINTNTISIVANFAIGSTATSPIIINEINYNSLSGNSSGDWIELYNPNSSAVNISGWYLQDNSGGYFNFPNNTTMSPGSYIVVVEDSQKFNTVYPSISVSGVFGNGIYSFGLSSNGEPIALYNANQLLIDSVNYDNNAPWPTEADGSGKTLQLMSSNLNNDLPGSWAAWDPTPKAVNSTNTPLPQSINFSNITDKLNSQPPFSLIATATSGLPVSFQVISGPATVNGNTLTLTGNTGTVTVQASQSGNVTYAAAPPVNKTFNVLAAPTVSYCTASGSNPSKQWIANVSLGNINNTSGINNYGNFTYLYANLNAGAATPIGLTAGFTPTETYNIYWRVWIDYNKNGTFESPSEIAFQGIKTAPAVGTTTSLLAGSIYIPLTALNGATRMRISARRNAYAPACGLFSFGEVEDYTVIIAGGSNSSGNLTMTCPGNTTVTAASGATSAIVNYMGPVANTTCGTPGTTISLISGLASGASFPIGTTTVIWQATDNCNNTKSCSFTVTVQAGPPPGGGYCTASASEPWQQWIAGVQTGTINNTSGKSNYSNFTAQSTTLLSGTTNNIKLTTGFSYTGFSSYWKVWIDYNHNNIFEEPGEVAIQYLKPAPANGTLSWPVTLPFSIPLNAVSGATRMRVALKRTAFATPCGTYQYGEVEDYTVNLVTGWEFTGIESAEQELLPNFSKASPDSNQPVLYPNPASSMLYILFPETDKPIQDFKIMDIHGREMWTSSKFQYPVNHLWEVDISSFPAGLYILSAIDGMPNAVVYKFVKSE